jgi:hypothetical protein
MSNLKIVKVEPVIMPVAFVGYIQRPLNDTGLELIEAKMIFVCRMTGKVLDVLPLDHTWSDYLILTNGHNLKIRNWENFHHVVLDNHQWANIDSMSEMAEEVS